jgi:hypothetical protein
MAHRGYLSSSSANAPPSAPSPRYDERATEEVRYTYDRSRGAQGEGRYERTVGEERLRTERARSSSDSLPFTDYPPDRPFINDDYRRDPNKPIKAFPESNRQGKEVIL